jgi:hypothetical protein
VSGVAFVVLPVVQIAIDAAIRDHALRRVRSPACSSSERKANPLVRARVQLGNGDRLNSLDGNQHRKYRDMWSGNGPAGTVAGCAAKYSNCTGHGVAPSQVSDINSEFIFLNVNLFGTGQASVYRRQKYCGRRVVCLAVAPRSHPALAARTQPVPSTLQSCPGRPSIFRVP